MLIFQYLTNFSSDKHREEMRKCNFYSVFSDISAYKFICNSR